MITVRKSGIRAISNRKDIENKDSEATVYLYGDIGGYFGGIASEEWVVAFNAIDAKTIHLRIDSDGGDVFAARAMKTAIMQHPAKVIAHIDGLAASAASFLAMGADEIEIVDGGFIMIHNAASFIDIFGLFNAADIEGMIEELGKEKALHEKINDAIATDYVKKTGNTKEQVLQWMDAETWFTAAEALDGGFVNRVYDGQPVEGSYDLSRFANTPTAVKERNQKASKRTIEKALRDAGLSIKDAKAVVANGFKDGLRDEDTPQEPQPANDTQRDAEIVNLRDEEAEPRKIDRTAELIKRAALVRNNQPTTGGN